VSNQEETMFDHEDGSSAIFQNVYTTLHGVKSDKILLFMLTAVRASNPASEHPLCIRILGNVEVELSFPMCF
jgi:hypothetical protein